VSRGGWTHSAAAKWKIAHPKRDVMAEGRPLTQWACYYDSINRFLGSRGRGCRLTYLHGLDFYFRSMGFVN